MAKKTNEAVVEEVKPAVTEARATAKTVRISARKVRYVLALVRGKDVEEALGILKFIALCSFSPHLKELLYALT